MTLGYDFPLLQVFFSILWFFLFVVWIMLLFHVIVDVFRSHDLSGLAKGLWLLLIFVLPLFGTLIYLIARGGSMTDRDISNAQAQEDRFRSYVQETAGSSGTADQVAQLAALRDSGIITDAEFEQGKAKVLA
ncbi:MAG TPA: SHOCT domain-containing protein [Acidimicrobiales bacterium]|jgi:hypothetical protein